MTNKTRKRKKKTNKNKEYLMHMAPTGRIKLDEFVWLIALTPGLPVVLQWML
jgi:hypothetical protein